MKFPYESVNLHCGSNTTERGTDTLVPVQWEFSGEEDCVNCIGTLIYKYIGRYSVDTSVVGEYTLRVEIITKNDSGIYRCIDDAGSGPDEASAWLIVNGEICKMLMLSTSQIMFAHSCGAG